MDKIVEGKLGAFYSQFVLLEQPFIRDNAVTIGQLVAQAVPFGRQLDQHLSQFGGECGFGDRGKCGSGRAVAGRRLSRRIARPATPRRVGAVRGRLRAAAWHSSDVPRTRCGMGGPAVYNRDARLF